MTGVIGRGRKNRPMAGKIGTVRPPLAVAGARAGAAIGGAGESRQLASGPVLRPLAKSCGLWPWYFPPQLDLDVADAVERDESKQKRNLLHHLVHHHRCRRRQP